MKRTLLTIALSAAASSMIAQDCSDLFISEYVVGSGNNRALELYNPTQNPIDLSTYKVGRFRDGAGTPMLLDLSGTIGPADVYVIVIDKRDPDGVDFEAPVDLELQAVADTFVNPVYVQANSPFYFNGDDAVPLFNGDPLNPANLLDVVGRIGEDPGTAWSDSSGTWWTTDKTLKRKSTILKGDADGLDEFYPEVEWDSLPENTFTGLGWHNCQCTPNSIDENKVAEINVYPNPSSDRVINISASQQIADIKVFNVIGNMVRSVDLSNKFSDRFRLDLGHLNTGLYIVNVRLENGNVVSRRLRLQ